MGEGFCGGGFSARRQRQSCGFYGSGPPGDGVSGRGPAAGAPSAPPSEGLGGALCMVGGQRTTLLATSVSGRLFLSTFLEEPPAVRASPRKIICRRLVVQAVRSMVPAMAS